MSRTLRLAALPSSRSDAKLSSVLRGSMALGGVPGDAGRERCSRERRSGDPAARDVASVFYVAKSENRNQVHYGVHLDASCSPVGTAPVFPYWRMLEHGPLAAEPLLQREVDAYGVAEQHVTERGHGGRRGCRSACTPCPSDRSVLETGRKGDSCDCNGDDGRSRAYRRCSRASSSSCGGPSA